MFTRDYSTKHVSTYPHINQTRKPHNMPLRAVLSIIRSPQHAAKIAEIRRESDLEACKDLKKALPYFVPTGVYTRRCNAGLVRHNGCVHGDIDKLGASLPAIREQLCGDPHVVCCFLSPGGDGLKLNVATSLLCTNNAEYRHAWTCVAARYKDRYGVTFAFDEAAKAISQPCYFSHDPACYENARAVPLDVPKAMPVDVQNVRIDWDTPGPTTEQKAMLVQEMLGSFEGARIRALYVDGDWSGYLGKDGNPDHNRGDYALLYYIGTYSDWDPAWMASVFLDSRLADDIERKPDVEYYLRHSIQKLIAAHAEDTGHPVPEPWRTAGSIRTTRRRRGMQSTREVRPWR